MSHPGKRATLKLISQRFVWPSMNKDCGTWVQNCLQCQKSKITRHVSSPIGKFSNISSRFEHIHLDIIHMTPSENKRYCLTCIDRFTRWPEAFPLEDQEAETVARAFYEGWICRFGTPLKITTDQGRQFESYLFKSLNRLTGTTHLRTSPYHPQANGMIERLHRQLKEAIRCHEEASWTKILPTVLLGIRASWKEDLKTSSAELLYGEPLKLPGQFLTGSSEFSEDPSSFIRQLRQHFQDLQPNEASNHAKHKPFVFKDLFSSESVFLRRDTIHSSLTPPYAGPFKVIKKFDKTFIIDINGKETNVSIDRLKPAFTNIEQINLQHRAYVNEDSFSQPNSDDSISSHNLNKQLSLSNNNKCKKIIRFCI